MPTLPLGSNCPGAAGMQPATSRNESSVRPPACGSAGGSFVSGLVVPESEIPQGPSDGPRSPHPALPRERKLAAYREAKQDLRRALGGVCRACGTGDRLQFDVVRPVGPEHHSMNVYSRLAFYLAQARAGNLQLLCQQCHSSKTVEDTRRRIAAKITARREAAGLPPLT